MKHLGDRKTAASSPLLLPSSLPECVQTYILYEKKKQNITRRPGKIISTDRANIKIVTMVRMYERGGVENM